MEPADSTLKKEHFKLRKHTRYLTIHKVVDQKSWQMLAYEERKRKERQKIPKIWRKSFLRYHLTQEKARQKFGRLRYKNRDDSVFVAKQWYFVLEKYPLKPRVEWSYQRVHKLNPRNERIATELEENLDCAERYSLILHFSDIYKTQLKNDVEKIAKIEKFRAKIGANRENLLRSQSLAAMKIRIFFEAKNGAIFDVQRDVLDLEDCQWVSVKKLREKLHSKISHFSHDVQNLILKKTAKNAKKRNIAHNCVVQETTNAAFNTIKNYLKIIKTKTAFISIDCMIVDRKLWVNSEQIRHFLKGRCILDTGIVISDCENLRNHIQ
ncbi:unnamed protein product [Caenorhabditis angaria]|uniref:Uncharacterized protein n=1 Tax=Caenorhabditis angaria TaxID=860376 RepID=A0A9P1IIB9_9PELO|nr:unnamed protein product [Caenorhabditis angaria]